MKRQSIILLSLIGFLFSANNHPIFLIHGFFGWGRDEMNGHYYWGGNNDFQTDLQNVGYDVFTLSVGPISSNWDRAAEAYAQIKGGCVDYGKRHSQEYGIIQQPNNKCYDGLYPEWDEHNPIHLIGHSQGGLTARMLEHLLMNEIKGEQSNLFSKNEGWIKSITTISTPHDGTTLAPIVMDIFPFAQTIASWVGSIDSETITEFYNFDLEQWGLQKRDGEKNKAFWKRIKSSKIKESKNFSSWDLSLEGSKQFNTHYVTNQDTYYFTFSTYATYKQDKSEKHIPDSSMRWFIWPAGLLIGQSEKADKSWYKNDGIVNTTSMYAPSTGKNGPAPFKLFDGVVEKGIWQSIETLHMDHHHVIGGHIPESESSEVFKIYLEHCSLLYSL
ncbi:MAG: lipase [Candidatus Marinimicrobia bacterium]|nr:lipase [Candidatus Neomarinimicrobiota bacterium]